MKCPDEDTLHEFVSGELSPEDQAGVCSHLQECESCRLALREVIRVHKSLREAVRSSECIPLGDLEGYIWGLLSAPEAEGVESHLETCEFCRRRLKLLDDALPEASEEARRQERVFLVSAAEDRAKDLAREALGKLVPSFAQLFDRVWERVSLYLEKLGPSSIDQLPEGEAPAALAGALGFAEEPDHRAEMAAVAVLIILSVQVDLLRGSVEREREAIRKRVSEIADRLGAGSELKRRLKEEVPELLLREK